MTSEKKSTENRAVDAHWQFSSSSSLFAQLLSSSFSKLHLQLAGCALLSNKNFKKRKPAKRCFSLNKRSPKGQLLQQFPAASSSHLNQTKRKNDFRLNKQGWTGLECRRVDTLSFCCVVLSAACFLLSLLLPSLSLYKQAIHSSNSYLTFSQTWIPIRYTICTTNNFFVGQGTTLIAIKVVGSCYSSSRYQEEEEQTILHFGFGAAVFFYTFAATLAKQPMKCMSNV